MRRYLARKLVTYFVTFSAALTIDRTPVATAIGRSPPYTLALLLSAIF